MLLQQVFKTPWFCNIDPKGCTNRSRLLITWWIEYLKIHTMFLTSFISKTLGMEHLQQYKFEGQQTSVTKLTSNASDS